MATKIVKKTGWIDPRDLSTTLNPRNINSTVGVRFDLQEGQKPSHKEVELSWEVELYKIKIIAKQKNGIYHLHLVNDISDHRLPYNLFKELISNLKAVHQSRLNWNLYSGQPVYEYETTVFDLKKTIEDLFNNIEVVYEQVD